MPLLQFSPCVTSILPVALRGVDGGGVEHTSGSIRHTPLVALPRFLSSPDLRSLPQQEPTSPGSPPNAGRRHCVVEGILLVAREGRGAGYSRWEPFHASHDIDGRLSFRSASGDGVEFTLDVNWQQPFLVAPHSSLPPEVAGDRHMWPFSLTYTPRMPSSISREQKQHQGHYQGSQAPLHLRRTVLMAVPSKGMRSKWLESFSQKAASYHFRQPSSTSPGSGPAACDGGSLSPKSWEAAGRRVALLGEPLRSLPNENEASLMSSPSRLRQVDRLKQPQLPNGRAHIWQDSTPLSSLRDLYDHYAADPVGFALGAEHRLLSLTASAPARVYGKRGLFLEKYVERQAEIERLLEKERFADVTPEPASPASASSSGQPGNPEGHRSCIAVAGAALADVVAAAAVVVVAEGADEAAGVGGENELPDARSVEPCGRFRMEACTPNAVLSEVDEFTVRDWSGGALFAAPCSHRFEFTLRLLMPPSRHPVFVGIAPADINLAASNLFNGDRSGIFLCVGGLRAEDNITPLGAMGGNCVTYAFGDKAVSRIPRLLTGDTLILRMSADQDASTGAWLNSKVRFVARSGSNIEAPERCSAVFDVPPADWRPCVLLCVPGTRVLVDSIE